MARRGPCHELPWAMSWALVGVFVSVAVVIALCASVVVAVSVSVGCRGYCRGAYWGSCRCAVSCRRGLPWTVVDISGDYRGTRRGDCRRDCHDKCHVPARRSAVYLGGPCRRVACPRWPAECRGESRRMPWLAMGTVGACREAVRLCALLHRPGHRPSPHIYLWYERCMCVPGCELANPTTQYSVRYLPYEYTSCYYMCVLGAWNVVSCAVHSHVLLKRPCCATCHDNSLMCDAHVRILGVLSVGIQLCCTRKNYKRTRTNSFAFHSSATAKVYCMLTAGSVYWANSSTSTSPLNRSVCPRLPATRQT